MKLKHIRYNGQEMPSLEEQIASTKYDWTWVKTLAFVVLVLGGMVGGFASWVHLLLMGGNAFTFVWAIIGPILAIGLVELDNQK